MCRARAIVIGKLANVFASAHILEKTAAKKNADRGATRSEESVTMLKGHASVMLGGWGIHVSSQTKTHQMEKKLGQKH